MYKIEGEDLFLIGTSEHSMIGKFKGQIVKEEDLPIRITGYSPCFRKEVGSHGLEERGLYRVHQFEKQEMIVLCKMEDQMDYMFIQRIIQELTQSCALPLPIPANAIPPLILQAAQHFWENDDQSIEERYFCLPNREFKKCGANNIAKVLYRKENKELVNTIERYTDGLIFTLQMREVIEILSAAKAPKKDGKGNPYADRIRMHMPLLDAMQSASTKAFMRAFNS